MSQKTLTGAEIVVETLIEEGTDTVFGYPGGQVLHIYEALAKKKRFLRHILTAHEQGAAHAADGYARASGRTGVVIATSGPGAANLVTGIATAYLDSVPLVAITGNVPTDQIGRDSFQELDIADITMPITKHNYIVKDPARLHDILHEAFAIAREGRRGPVLVDIPKDIQTARIPCPVSGPLTPKPPVSPSEDELREAAALLGCAERPLVYCGGGVVSADAGALLTALAEKLDAPIGCSLMGLSAVPSAHPLALGLTGMHGLAHATGAVARADVILAVGTRFPDRATGSRGELVGGAKIVQLDIDPAEVDKNVRDASYVIGDLPLSLRALYEMLPSVSHAAWRAEIGAMRAAEPSDPGAFTPFAVIDAVSRYAGDAVIVTDVGQHQMWAAQRCPIRRERGFLTSGGLGTMGFGMGAAIGASVAEGGAPVLLYTGDGSFGMNLTELATAVTEKLPLVIVLMNNRSLGMVKQWQNLLFGRAAYTNLDRATDFVKVAEGFGARGAHVSDLPSLENALAAAFSPKNHLPFVIDCAVDPDAHVEPLYK